MCKDCERWLNPPNQWVMAFPESRELLALCLRRLRGLQRVRIIDAGFLWTEPHSRRIKVKITVQQEVFQGTILQQTFQVEYVVRTQQCPDCAKSYTANTWRASVQVRQKVPHKRTFLYLEQLILKHGAHKDTINIKEVKDGLDFFFAQRNHAERMVDFLTSVAPVKTKKSQELISMDVHTSMKSYKFSFSVELVPICKDDIVVLPIKLARQYGNISPLTLCYRVGTSIGLLDPGTLQTTEIPAPVYWRAPFGNLADIKDLVEFVVMDIEPLGRSNGRFFLAEATIAPASDMGTMYFTRTHLGSILHPGDSVMGYHLSRTNFNHDDFEALQANSTYSSTIPDVVLVRKAYPRKKKTKRNWKVKRIAREFEEEPSTSKKNGEQSRLEDDFETFLQDVEEDPELRSTMALYKAKKAQQRPDQEAMSVENDDDDGIPKINMDELLDDFEELNVQE